MSINWSFIILDKNNYIKNLVTSLNYDDLYFYEDGDEGIDLTYYFSSIHLNHLTDPIQIYSKAQQLCSLLNGLDLIIQEDKAEHYPIVLDRLIDINNEYVNETPEQSQSSYNQKALQAKVFPNPAEDIITVDFQTPTDNNLQVFVMDTKGSEMLRREFYTYAGSHSFTIDISQYPTGTYVVYLQHGAYKKVIQFVKL